MSEQQVFIEIAPEELLERAQEQKAAGARFVQCHAMRGLEEGQLDVVYSFSDDVQLTLTSFVLHVPAPQESQSCEPSAESAANAAPEAAEEPATLEESPEGAEGSATPAEEAAAPSEAAGPCVPSISELFPSAFIFENEMHDLYGIHVSGITLDYRGGFYHVHVPNPMAAAPVKPAKKAPAAR